MTVCEWWWDGYVLSTDPSRLEGAVVRRCLKASCQCPAADRCEDTATRDPLGDPLLFGLYDGGRQVGLARAMPDGRQRQATLDLFLPPDCWRRPLYRWLAEAAGAHPALFGMRLDLSVSSLPQTNRPPLRRNGVCGR